MHERSANSGPTLTHLPVRVDIAYGRQERLEQVCVEREQEVRIGKVHGGQPRGAGHELHRLANRGWIERIVGDDIGCAQAGGKPFDDGAHRAAVSAAGDDGHSCRRCLLLLKLRDEQLLRFFPRDRLVLSRPSLPGQFQRRPYAIGMVKHLYSSLAAGTRASHADRVLGVPLDFFRLHCLDALLLTIDRANRLPLHHANGDAASGRALLTDRAHPAFFAGDEPILRDQERNELLWFTAPVEDEAGRTSDAAGLEKISSFHVCAIYDKRGNRRSLVFPCGNRCTCPSSI